MKLFVIIIGLCLMLVSIAAAPKSFQNTPERQPPKIASLDIRAFEQESLQWSYPQKTSYDGGMYFHVWAGLLTIEKEKEKAV